MDNTADVKMPEHSEATMQLIELSTTKYPLTPRAIDGPAPVAGRRRADPSQYNAHIIVGGCRQQFDPNQSHWALRGCRPGKSDLCRYCRPDHQLRGPFHFRAFAHRGFRANRHAGCARTLPGALVVALNRLITMEYPSVFSKGLRQETGPVVRLDFNGFGR